MDWAIFFTNASGHSAPEVLMELYNFYVDSFDRSALADRVFDAVLNHCSKFRKRQPWIQFIFWYIAVAMDPFSATHSVRYL
jgi:hypothetical protein